MRLSLLLSGICYQDIFDSAGESRIWQEKFSLNHVTDYEPRLLHYDDQAQALVLENIDTKGLVNLFSFIQAPRRSLAAVRLPIGAVGEGLARMHESVAVGVISVFSESDRDAIYHRSSQVVEHLRGQGYRDLPGSEELRAFFARVT